MFNATLKDKIHHCREKENQEFIQTEWGLLITDDFKKFNKINWLLFSVVISTSSSVNVGKEVGDFSDPIHRVYPSGPHS
jgi:hypothetical protein